MLLVAAAALWWPKAAAAHRRAPSIAVLGAVARWSPRPPTRGRGPSGRGRGLSLIAPPSRPRQPATSSWRRGVHRGSIVSKPLAIVGDGQLTLVGTGLDLS
jgi:hypothetical protein